MSRTDQFWQYARKQFYGLATLKAMKKDGLSLTSRALGHRRALIERNAQIDADNTPIAA